MALIAPDGGALVNLIVPDNLKAGKTRRSISPSKTYDYRLRYSVDSCAQRRMG